MDCSPTKNVVPKFLSRKSITRAEAITGVARRIIQDVTSTVHTKRERFPKVTPGFRSLKIVVMKLTEPRMEDEPSMVTPRIHMSIPLPASMIETGA